jgi:DNA invertase Pin-like site-specific DNA recombinase
MTVYGYRRVSSAGQAAEEKTSLADQEMKIRGVAMVHGMGDPVIFTDPGVSGSIPLSERPEGGKLWRLLAKGDLLICAKLDRLFRSAADALVTADTMKARGVSLILINLGMEPVTGVGMAKFYFSMMAAVAELEKEQILERMRDGKKSKAAKGGHIGGYSPYGFRKIGIGKTATLEPDPSEQVVIDLIRQFEEAGNSLRSIARKLALMGHTTRIGSPWSAVQISRILRRSDGGFSAAAIK